MADKFILKRRIETVRCPRFRHTIAVRRSDDVLGRNVCKECGNFVKETCGYIKCSWKE